MKRANYREAVMIVALNDEPTIMEPEELVDQVSVALIADIFDVPVERVAQDIVRIRRKEMAVDRSGEAALLKMRQEDRRLGERYGIDAGLARDDERQERGRRT
jgi:hypothetical protein